MRRITAIWVVLFASSAMVATPNTSAQAPGPSFNCANATNDIERLVCDDPDLARLDRRLADVYARALATWPADIIAEQRAMQRGWISGRDECWKSDNRRACVDEAYKIRIVELQIRSGQLMVPTSVGFDCAGGDSSLPFTAVYYRQTDPASGVFTYGNDQVVAFATPTGSGARYTASGFDFWEHQGEATVDFFGIELKCTPR